MKLSVFQCFSLCLLPLVLGTTGKSRTSWWRSDLLNVSWTAPAPTTFPWKGDAPGPLASPQTSAGPAPVIPSPSWTVESELDTALPREEGRMISAQPAGHSLPPAAQGPSGTLLISHSDTRELDWSQSSLNQDEFSSLHHHGSLLSSSKESGVFCSCTHGESSDVSFMECSECWDLLQECSLALDTWIAGFIFCK